MNGEGYQPARTGHGYAGIFVTYYGWNYREYIEIPLDSTLRANKKYCVEFYVSLADTSQQAISNIGAYFSHDSVLDSDIVLQQPTIDYVTPQFENPTTNMLTDKTNWMLVSGNFIANGGERFMTIGNFHKDTATNIQNVGSGTQPFAYYYIDDVSLVYCDPSGVEELSNEGGCEVYPNPANESLTLTLSKEEEIREVRIYNVLGECVYQSTVKQLNNLTINISALPKGLYFINIKNATQSINRKFVKE